MGAVVAPLATSKPVIVSEYALQSDTAFARALGDIACEEGAIGTGNGRNVQYCGQQEKKESWLKENKTTLIGVTVAGIGIFMVSKMQLPIQLQVTEDAYKIGIYPNGFGLSYSEDEVLVTYRFEF